MKILLIGASGKMGREVISVCQNLNDKVVCGVDREYMQINGVSVFDDIKLVDKSVDVIIDFSTCENRQDYINYSKENCVPYCCFSTLVSDDDYKRLQSLSKIVPVLVCSNTSRGMNALFDMLEICKTRLVGADVAVSEYHHKWKKDSPSGSAKSIIKNLESVFEDLQISAFRVASEKGTHRVEFYLDDEVIEISHKVLSRRVFAVGAVEMANKLLEKENGLFDRL